jgi:hypothetical protein
LGSSIGAPFESASAASAATVGRLMTGSPSSSAIMRGSKAVLRRGELRDLHRTQPIRPDDKSCGTWAHMPGLNVRTPNQRLSNDSR